MAGILPPRNRTRQALDRSGGWSLLGD